MNATPNPETEAETRALAAFAELTDAQQDTLLRWIAAHFIPAPRIGRHTSFDFRQAFVRITYLWGEGFHLTGPAFKGGMLKAGFAPVQASEPNWRFRYRAAKPCAGHLWAGSLGTRPCDRPADVISGLCSYHARFGVDMVPVQPPETVEQWIKSRGYNKYPSKGGQR